MFYCSYTILIIVFHYLKRGTKYKWEQYTFSEDTLMKKRKFFLLDLLQHVILRIPQKGCNRWRSYNSSGISKPLALPMSVVYSRRELNFFFMQKCPYLMTFIVCREHPHIIFIRMMLKFNREKHWWQVHLPDSYKLCWREKTSKYIFYKYLIILNKQPSHGSDLNMYFWKKTHFVASVLLVYFTVMRPGVNSGKFQKVLVFSFKLNWLI